MRRRRHHQSRWSSWEVLGVWGEHRVGRMGGQLEALDTADTRPEDDSETVNVHI